MASSTIRKALGAVKDQTSIGLAKVSSNIAPELDVAIVKATSHDDDPADEKYIREILSLTSFSRGAYVGACVASVSRRLGKTRDWIVALKALVLIHRLLTDGDRAFQNEILYATRRGTRLLNMSDFRDEAHSSSWDHSAFVRTYAMYLDQRLELLVYERKQSGNASPKESYGDDRYGKSPRESYGDDRYRKSPYGDDRYRKSPREEEKRAPPAATPLKEMEPEQVLGRMHQMQRVLDRFLACRPTGSAKNCRMVLVALYNILRESFRLYADICEVLAVLLDRFFDMEYPDCVKSFEAYAGAAKQIDELAAFYSWCKDVGVARSSEYPEVQRITDKLLGTLEEFMKDRARRPQDSNANTNTPQVLQIEPAPAVEEEEEEPPVQDMNGMKALPAPPGFDPEEKVGPAPPQKPREEADLLNLKDAAVSADEHGNSLALALFSGGQAAAGNGSWEAFPSNGEATSAWDTPAAEKGKADWELALVESTSNLSRQKAALAGGFDQLLLSGMYDQGAVRQQVNAQISGGSASSVALPSIGRGTTPVLALPAPDGTIKRIGEDPFAASVSFAPPSYVQMSDMEKKQQLLVQEQQVWLQYAQNGMQGQSSLAKLNNGYNPAVPYGMPSYNPNAAGYYYPPY